MAGSASVPNLFVNQSGTVPASQLDANWSALVSYINVREIVFNTLGSRPVAGTSGRLYFSTDTFQMFADNGLIWLALAPPTTGVLNAVGQFTPGVFF